MKRFSETSRWDEPWYRTLRPRYKCLFEYIWSRCDHAGVWTVDISLASTFVGEKLDEKECLTALSGKIIDLGNGRWLLPEFIKVQYKKLTPTSTPHRRVLETMVGHGLAQNETNDSYPTGRVGGGLLASPKEEDKYKEEEEDKDKKGGSKGGAGCKSRGTVEELKAYAVERGFPESDGQHCFDKWEGNGWKNDGRPIIDWKGTMRAWAASGYLASQKHENNNRSNGVTGRRFSVVEERNSQIVGAEATKRAILAECDTPERKPWSKP